MIEDPTIQTFFGPKSRLVSGKLHKKAVLSMLFTQGLSFQIQIVKKVNVISNICSKHIKYYRNELLLTLNSMFSLYYEIRFNQIWTFIKTQEIWTKFFKFYFSPKYIWQDYTIKVKI